MDIIKITGAAVVLMSSFMLGMYFVVVNKTRIKNLADIDETWRTISAEIRFQSGSLPEIFKRFASHEYSFGIKTYMRIWWLTVKRQHLTLYGGRASEITHQKAVF